MGFQKSSENLRSICIEFSMLFNLFDIIFIIFESKMSKLIKNNLIDFCSVPVKVAFLSKEKEF